MFDTVALGELLIDFTQNGFSPQGNLLFEANPGGAPCNVLAMLQKLGKKTAFISKVGNDQFGKLLKESLNSVGISTEALFMDNDVHTTLAFVHTAEDGDRDFSFYRNPGADMMLTEEDIPEKLLQNTKVFHFGTLSMTSEYSRRATKKAIDIAQKHGALLSFDPNLREALWDCAENAKEQIIFGLSKCNILKISGEELEFVTGKKDYDEGAAVLREISDIDLIIVTMGKLGSRAYYKQLTAEEKAFVMPNTIETTDAGDTFAANVINYILEHDLQNLTEQNLHEMLRYANAAAAIVTTRYGALKVMPSKQEIDSLLSRKYVHYF
jgi:fructokinase